MMANLQWRSLAMALTCALGFKPTTKTELQTAVNLYISNPTGSVATNGEISTWDTSLITDMSSLFLSKSTFNGDIGSWDTSSVTQMQMMFGNAQAFNQNIGAWDVSAVTDMSSMFSGASVFNQNIGAWDTSQVTNMNQMFMNAPAFNQPIGGWDTSQVTGMAFMFMNAVAFNQHIGNWDTSQVTTMALMFTQARAFNQPIAAWDTSQVTVMQSMFYQADVFNQPIANWDTSRVTSMSYMFREANDFDQNIGSWDTSSVANFNGMFQLGLAFNQYLGLWDTSSKTSCTDMFAGSAVTCVTSNLVGCGITDICPATTGTTTTSTSTSTSTWSTTSTPTSSTTTISWTSTVTTTSRTTTTTSTTTSTTATTTTSTTATSSTTTTFTTTATASTTTSTTPTTTTSTTETLTTTTSSTRTTTASTTVSTTPTTTTSTTAASTATTSSTTATGMSTTSTASTTTTSTTTASITPTTSTATTTSTTTTTTSTTTKTATTSATATTTVSTTTTAATATTTTDMPMSTTTSPTTDMTMSTTTTSKTPTSSRTSTSASTSTTSSTWTTTREALSTTTRPPILDRLIIQIDQPTTEQILSAQAVQGKAFIQVTAQDTAPAVTKALANTKTITNLEFPVSEVTVVKLADAEVSDKGYAHVTSPSSNVSVAIPLESLTQDLRLEPGESSFLVLTEFLDEVFEKAASTTGVIFAIGVTLHDANTGLPLKVEGLTEPIEFTVREPYAAGKRCAFFDEEKVQWSTVGVVTPEGQIVGEGMRCQTYHLSVFGVLLPGFLTTFICSNLDLFSREALSNLVSGHWFLTTAAWFFWTVMVVLGTVFTLGWRVDVHRSRTFVWNDEFFLIPTGGINQPDQPSDMSEDSEEERSKNGANVKARFTGTSAVATGSCCPSCCGNSAFKETLDEIGAKWFEHVAELRAILEGVWEAMELSSLTSAVGYRRGVFAACHIVVSHMVLYSSRQLAAAEMSLDAGLVAFVMDNKEFEEMLIAAQEEASKQKELAQCSHHWSVHNDATQAWKSLLDMVSHQVRLHVYRHTCQELPRMAYALYTAHNPLGSVFHFSPFMSCKMRAFFVWTEIVGSIFTSTVFYSSQGGTQRRSLDAGTGELASNDNGEDLCAVAKAEDDFFFITGRAVAVALFSAIVATIPLLVLAGIRTRGVRRMDYKGCPEWNRQLRVWAIQDWTTWIVGTVYLIFCHFFIVLFLANIDKSSVTDWIVTTVLGVVYHCILIPTSLAVLMPLMAAASVRCLSAVARMHRDELVRGIHEHLHRKTNAMLPIMHI